MEATAGSEHEATHEPLMEESLSKSENGIMEAEVREESLNEHELQLLAHLRKLVEQAPPGQTETITNLCKMMANKQRPYLLEQLNREAEDAREETVVEASELIGALQLKLDTYCKELFLENSAKATLNLQQSCLSIHIAGRKFNCKNYLNALWESKWNVHLQAESLEISGVVSSYVHSYEEGNIQLQASRQFAAVKLHGSHETEVEKMADKIYWKIRDNEDAVQVSLNESYARLTDQALKRLRRQLPVTRTKMDWNKFCGYKLSTELIRDDQ